MMASQQIKLLCFFKVIWYYCFIDYHNKWKCNTKWKKLMVTKLLILIASTLVAAIYYWAKNPKFRKKIRDEGEHRNISSCHKRAFSWIILFLGKFICALLFIYMLIKVKTPYSSYMLTPLFVLRRKDNPKVMTLLPITSFVSKKNFIPF